MNHTAKLQSLYLLIFTRSQFFKRYIGCSLLSLRNEFGSDLKFPSSESFRDKWVQVWRRKNESEKKKTDKTQERDRLGPNVSAFKSESVFRPQNAPTSLFSLSLSLSLTLSYSLFLSSPNSNSFSLSLFPISSSPSFFLSLFPNYPSPSLFLSLSLSLF